MNVDEDVRALLAVRAIQPKAVSKLTAGQKNVTSLVESTAGDRYVVRQYTTAVAAEVEYELAAVDYLSARGFRLPLLFELATEVWSATLAACLLGCSNSSSGAILLVSARRSGRISS